MQGNTSMYIDNEYLNNKSISKEMVSLREKSLEKCLNLYLNQYNGHALNKEQFHKIFIEINEMLSVGIKMKGIDDTLNVGFTKKYINVVSQQNNLEVVRNMIKKKDERKKTLENKLNMSRAKFLNSSMAKYMRETTNECDSYEQIIGKLCSLEKPLSYDIDEGRKERV